MSFNISEQYDRLYRYCYYHIHDRILAQDIVQETFTRYMERYGSLEEKEVVETGNRDAIAICGLVVDVVFVIVATCRER